MFKIEKKIRILALVIISGVIITGFSVGTFLIFYEDIKEFNGSFEIHQNDHDVSKIELFNNVKIGTISFKLLSEDSINIIEAFWDIQYNAGILESEVISIKISNDTVGDILKLVFEIENLEYALTREFILLNITVLVSPIYDLYNFTSDTEAGNVNFDAKGIEFGHFEVKTTTGDVDIGLNRSIIISDLKVETTIGDQFLTLDFITFHEDIVGKSTSGFIFYDFWNIEFLSDGDLKVSATTGKIHVRWATHFKKSHIVDVSLETNFDIEFRYWYPLGNTRFDVFFSETTGSSHFGATAALFNDLSPYHYQSKNIGDTSIDFLKVNVTTREGDIYLKVIDCFKPQRFCRQYGTTPHTENATGSYSIPITDYEVSTIKFYNRAANVNIDYNSLPANSANIFEVNWLITYWHGANYGFGRLDVKFTPEIEGNTLIIYIDLVYEIDRLRPVFTECDFTIQVNPSYTYSAY